MQAMLKRFLRDETRLATAFIAAHANTYLSKVNIVDQ